MYKFKFKKLKIKFPTNIIIEGRRIMNYYNEIKEKLIKYEVYDRAKDYSKDRNKVNVYYKT